MASLREAARSVYEDARDAIGWIAVWKTGRSWHAECFYDIEYTEPSKYIQKENWGWKMDMDIAGDLQEIVKKDPEARLMNAYYSNMGTLEEMTLETLQAGILFQYSLGGNLGGIIEECMTKGMS